MDRIKLLDLQLRRDENNFFWYKHDIDPQGLCFGALQKERSFISVLKTEINDTWY